MPFFCCGKLDAVFTPSEAKNGYFTPSEANAIEKQFESYFKTLKPGDVIIQNGANSMVGMAIVQMAIQMGVKTINIVRSDRYLCNNMI
jgi:NADPH:quinone reductase-like Zn-dependent oxidoreductase